MLTSLTRRAFAVRAGFLTATAATTIEPARAGTDDELARAVERCHAAQTEFARLTEARHGDDDERTKAGWWDAAAEEDEAESALLALMDARRVHHVEIPGLLAVDGRAHYRSEGPGLHVIMIPTDA